MRRRRGRFRGRLCRRQLGLDRRSLESPSRLRRRARARARTEEEGGRASLRAQGDKFFLGCNSLPPRVTVLRKISILGEK